VTPALPRPVPLPDPPGSPDALAEVVDQLGSAGFAAGLTVHLLEPAAVLPGWHGADATAAAAEIGTAVAVAGDLHLALLTAGMQLADHHELWQAVLAGVVRLREEQQAQFAAAGSRLAALVGTAAESGVPVDPPAEALDLVRTVAQQDAGRATTHAALLATLAEDATAVAAGLATATAPFGGPGEAADAAAVTARLAVRLPGWGAGALAALGTQAAEDLTRPGTGDELDAAVARWRGYAVLPGFADALVGRLGADGVGWLLAVVGDRAGTGEEEPLAALLAGVLGSAGSSRGSPPGSPSGRGVAEVLAEVRLDAETPVGTATGMAVVLAAPGVGPSLAALWGGQALARERAQGTRAAAGATGGGALPDPVDAALAVLARAGDPAAAAGLLADPAAWTTLLTRPWPDGTAELATVVGLAARAPTADQAARSALLALGTGLSPGRDGRVLDDRIALSGIRWEVTGLVAGQPGVVLPVLDAAGSASVPDPATDTALRGLGHLVADAAAADEVTAAVRAALQAGDAGARAGEVAGAHVAVLEYGQRLRYALAWSQAQDRAVDAQMLWTLTVSGPVAALRGTTGELAGVVEDVLADALDANGDVEIGPDTGRVRTAEDAARFAAGALGPTAAPGAEGPPEDVARLAFDRAGRTLGGLSAPEESLLDRLGDLPLPDRSHRPRRRE
jgi:hypothetical protein